MRRKCLVKSIPEGEGLLLKPCNSLSMSRAPRLSVHLSYLKRQLSGHACIVARAEYRVRLPLQNAA